MPEEHLEAARRFIDAVNRGDHAGAVRLVHEEVVFEPLRTATEGAFTGPEGIAKFLADTAEMFEVFRVDPIDLRELPDGRVLGIGSIRVRGRGSGLETDIPTAAIAEYRDGLLWRFKDYGKVEEALEAAGLAG